jgi:hypothetical protein
MTNPRLRSRLFFCRSVGLLCASVLLASCATHRAPPPGPPPQYLELFSSPAVATVHVPRGLYVLSSSDSSGFYYSAPQGVTKHSFAGPQPYDGGVFVSRRNRHKLRGYIIWAAGRTKIGDLSGRPYRFRD